MTTQYLVLVTLPSGAVEQVWASGVVDPADEDDRPSDAALRAVLVGRKGCLAVLATEAGLAVRRQV